MTGWLRTPSKFKSAFALSIITSVMVLGIVVLTMYVFERSGAAMKEDILVIYTLFVSLILASTVLWAAASKRIGYIWA